MNVLIFEDETAASNRLKSMLKSIVPDVTVLAVLDSVEDAVEWLKSHREPDIIFADIQLSDGICFDIFRKVQPSCAIIFTTAYDEYAVDAFKVNSIDYLLKPVDPTALSVSIDKFHSMKRLFGSPDKRIESLLTLLDQGAKGYKTRFLVKSGHTMKPVSAASVRYFLIDNQLIFLVDGSAKRYLVEHTLDELESLLDPSHFFRINRQMIVALDAVAAIHPYFNSRLKLELLPELKSEVIVSRLKVPDFKKWLDR